MAVRSAGSEHVGPQPADEGEGRVEGLGVQIMVGRELFVAVGP